MTELVNIRHTKDFDIYIGRLKKNKLGYGNPFVIGKDGDRETVWEKHRKWLFKEKPYEDFMVEERKWVYDNINVLMDKKIGCFCYPKKCHGENLIKLLETLNG